MGDTGQPFTSRSPDRIMSRAEMETLIELRADVRNLIERIDRTFAEFRAGLTADRSEASSRFTALEARTDRLEQRFDRLDGATAGTRFLMAGAFSAGGLLVTATGLALKATGHL